MKNLFKVFFLVVVLFSFSEAKAQYSAGLGVHYGTDINNIGFSINGKYEINEQWSAAPSFTLFLKKDYITWSALDLDANYKITEIEKVGGLYGLAGLNMTFYKIKYDLGTYAGNYTDTGVEVGLNLGVGINIPIDDKLVVAPEVRYTLGGASYLRIGAKVMYTF